MGHVLNICRNGTAVEVTVDSGLAIERSRFQFKWETNSDWAAELLANKLRKRVGDAVQAARKEAYEEGWRDAKAKKSGKQTFFPWVI